MSSEIIVHDDGNGYDGRGLVAPAVVDGERGCYDGGDCELMLRGPQTLPTEPRHREKILLYRTKPVG